MGDAGAGGGARAPDEGFELGIEEDNLLVERQARLFSGSCIEDANGDSQTSGVGRGVDGLAVEARVDQRKVGILLERPLVRMSAPGQPGIGHEQHVGVLMSDRDWRSGEGYKGAAPVGGHNGFSQVRGLKGGREPALRSTDSHSTPILFAGEPAHACSADPSPGSARSYHRDDAAVKCWAFPLFPSQTEVIAALSTSITEST